MKKLLIPLLTGTIIAVPSIGEAQTNFEISSNVKVSVTTTKSYPTFLDGERWQRGHNFPIDLKSIVKNGKIYVDNSAAGSALFFKGYQVEYPPIGKTGMDISKPLIVKKNGKIIDKIPYYKEKDLGYISADSLKKYGINVTLKNNQVLVTTVTPKSIVEKEFFDIQKLAQQGQLKGINIWLHETESSVVKKYGKGKDMGGEGGSYWIDYPSFSLEYSSDVEDVGRVTSISVQGKQIKNKNWLKTPSEIEKILGKPVKVHYWEETKEYTYIYEASNYSLMFTAKGKNSVINGIQIYAVSVDTW